MTWEYEGKPLVHWARAVGEVLYPPYNPAGASIVVAIDLVEARQGRYEQRLTVMDRHGQKAEWSGKYVKEFDQLIEDHRRKLATHEGLAARLREIAKENTP